MRTVNIIFSVDARSAPGDGPQVVAHPAHLPLWGPHGLPGCGAHWPRNLPCWSQWRRLRSDHRSSCQCGLKLVRNGICSAQERAVSIDNVAICRPFGLLLKCFIHHFWTALLRLLTFLLVAGTDVGVAIYYRYYSLVDTKVQLFYKYRHQSTYRG